MKKWPLTVSIIALTLAPLHADVTIIQTMTMEGPAAGMIGGQQPTMTYRIKGLKARSDVEVMGQTVVAITDVAEKRVILLQPQAKTAQLFTPASAAAGGPSMAVPSVDAALKPTGKSQVIEGVRCDEHTFRMTLSMAELSGQAQMPPETAAMLKDVTMLVNGSIWIAKAAPGAAEFVAFGKAAADSGLLSSVSGLQPGQSGGLDRLMSTLTSAPGIPYLAELTMTFQGSGPMVDALKQMGAMKMIQKTSSVSTAAINDDVFRIPEGYTIEK